MKATDEQIRILLQRHGIAPLAVSGSDSAQAARGGRLGRLRLLRENGRTVLELTVGGVSTVAPPPGEPAEALAILRPLQSAHALPADESFARMLGDLLVKSAALFEDSAAVELDFSSLRLHPASYHIGSAELVTDKPLHLKARMEPDSHDRRAVFDHRHGDALKNPK